MFKRRLVKSRRKGDSGNRSYCKQHDGGSDTSSVLGGTSSVGSHCSGPHKSILKSSKPQHQCNSYEIDGQRSKACGSTTDTTHSIEGSIGHIQQPGGENAKKSVTFAHVHIREFERILGDNPSCSSGAPIGLGWAYGNERTVDLDKYEDTRFHRHRKLPLVLSRQIREEFLLEWGVSFHDIIEAIRTNIKIKNQRRRTVNAIGTYDRWEEVMENASRKIKQTLLSKKTKEEGLPVTPKKLSRKKEQELHGHSQQAPKRPIRTRDFKNTGSQRTMMESLHTAGSSRVSKTSGDSSSPHPIEDDDDEFGIGRPTTAPISELYFDHQNPNLAYVNTGYAVIPCVMPDANQDDDEVTFIDDDMTIASRNFESEPVNNENPTGFFNVINNPRFLSAMDDPRFLEAMDDPGAFLNFDDMSVTTPMSEFTYADRTMYDEDEEDDDDELDDLDRDVSHWEVRSSGQDCPAIRRKGNPVEISEDSYYDLDGHWEERFTMPSPPNSANIVSSWE